MKNPDNFRNSVASLELPSEWPEGTGSTADWVQTVDSLLCEHHETALTRQQLSRKIGALKKAGESAEAELEEMRQISQRLAEVDTVIEEHLRDADGWMSGPDEQTDSANSTPTQTALPLFMKHAPNSSAQGPENQKLTVSADFDDSEWQAYVSAHKGHHIYHDLRWRDVIEKSFGRKTDYQVARDSDHKVVGIMPLARLESPLFGKFLVSLPYFTYGGPLGDHVEIENKLIEAAAELSESNNLEHVEIRDVAPRQDMQQKTNKVSMVLNLPENREALESSLGSKLRSQVKRAEREGATCLVGGVELLDKFYTVFSRNMRDLGTPVYTRNFFKNILQAFPENAYLHIIEINGKPAAAGFLLAHNDTVEIPWASSLRRYNKLSVNMLLYRSVLEWSITEGYQFFDFGRSSVDGPTFKFKQQWGSEPVQLHWHYCLREGQTLPSLSPDNPKFALFIAVWKKLPLFVSNAVGPHIVKHLP